MRVEPKAVPGNREAEPGQLGAPNSSWVETTTKSASGVDGLNVSVDRKAADQAPRHTQALKQLNRGLEIAAAALKVKSYISRAVIAE